MPAADMDDPYELRRFLDAQEPCFGAVCAELTAGRKASHWMWFIFPQLQGLGSSPTARYYAIGSLAEARAYLAHPLLGARLRQCTSLVNALEGTSAQAVFGYPDYLKFHSCMTLFAHAADEGDVGPDSGPFGTALARYFAGEADPLTRELLTVSRTSG